MSGLTNSTYYEKGVLTQLGDYSIGEVMNNYYSGEYNYLGLDYLVEQIKPSIMTMKSGSTSGKDVNNLLETIWKLGIDDIMRKHLTWGDKDLITTSQVANGQIQVGERRWVMVPNMTKDKAKLLRVVAAMLRINLEITII